MRTLLVMLLAGAAAGCMTSPAVEKSARPRTAEGLAVSLDLMNGRTIAGELLMLDSASVTLLTPEGITVAPHVAVEEVRFAGFPRLRPDRGMYYLPPGIMDRIRLESRYPYGIPDPALQAIMRAKSQSRVDTVGAQ